MVEKAGPVFIDFETASAVDLKTAGGFRYAVDETTKAIVLAYALGDQPAEVWHADGTILDWAQAPAALVAAVERGADILAWNMTFDAAIWNYATIGFPLLDAGRCLDPMVQALASNLPGDLQSASTRLGGEGKQLDGKALIRLFCREGAAPADHPEEWIRFLAYARQDIEAMRFVWHATRPLSEQEWCEYQAFEAINWRGIGIDVAFVEKAAAMAAVDQRYINQRIRELTDDAANKVTQAARLQEWLFANLPDATMRAMLLKIGDEDEAADDDEEEEEDDRPALSLRRSQVSQLVAALSAKRERHGLDAIEERCREVAVLREFGAGAAPKKFPRMIAQQVGGAVHGQYLFNGAGQTGRLSSRQIQIHNLSRDTLGPDGANEAETVDAIADGCDHATLARMAPADVPVTRKLALLVRPALVAGPGKTFVWSDWSAIEARVLPWLASSVSADAILAVFRANDIDSSKPDIYKVAAAGIYHKPAHDITKAERQIGKVTVLSLGFGGGWRALMRMALAYGVYIEVDEAKEIVAKWRAANGWARAFWGLHQNDESYGLWGAAMRAWENPGQITEAGRVAFAFDSDYLGGALFMSLPSGRLLTYPRPNWREVDVKDDDGRVTGRRSELTFRRAHGRTRLWHGTLAENAVQATAADVLRGTVARLEGNPDLAWMPVRATTHDEVLVECDVSRAAEARAILRAGMLRGFDWSEGLPLMSEETCLSWYSKMRAA